jgi:hypothetical protein
MAEVTYLNGREPSLLRFEELEDLDKLIETGPDWREIDQIIITLNRPALIRGYEHKHVRS